MLEGFLSYLISELPDIDFLQNPLDWAVLNTPLNWLGWVNYYLPMETFSTCISVIFSVFIVGCVARAFFDLL